MSRRVVVVGSANVDRTIEVETSPARGETVLGERAGLGPGGKGLNQAVAAGRLGADTAFVGAVGSDPDGDLLLRTLREAGVDVGGVARVAEPTGQAMILLEPDGSNRIVVVPGANDRIDPTRLDGGSGDVLVVQAEIPLAAVAGAVSHGRDRGATVVLNAAPARSGLDRLLPSVDVLVVNEAELAALAGTPTSGSVLDQVAEAAGALPARRGVVVTLGSRGALAVTDGGRRHLPAPQVTAVDTTGAGDCFVGALAAELSTPADLLTACETAVRAAAHSVTIRGAAPSMPTRAELGLGPDGSSADRRPAGPPG